MILAMIPLKSVRPNPNLRIAVYKACDFYSYLVMSVKDRGVLTPILVRPVTNGYEIVKGLHRYHAALDEGHDAIPAQIMELTDLEVEEIRMVSSVHRAETRPMDYQRALLRLCENLPTLTLRDMAKRLKVQMQWIRDILFLSRLNKAATRLVDNDKIPLGNAYILTKLHEDNQENFLKQAQELKFDEFYQLIKAEDLRIRVERRAQYRGKPENKICVAHIRREFYEDGVHDGGETEFVYTDSPIAESLKGCKTIEEARVILQEPAKVGYHWIVTQVQLKDRTIV